MLLLQSIWEFLRYRTHARTHINPHTWCSSVSAVLSSFAFDPGYPIPPLPSLPSHPLRPASVLAGRLGGDTGAVSHQQSHCASAGHRDRHTGGSPRARARRVRASISLVGVGAHVTLKLRCCFALYATELAEQYPASACPAEATPCPATFFPLLPVVLLSMDAKVGESGEAWKTTDSKRMLSGVVIRAADRR